MASIPSTQQTRRTDNRVTGGIIKPKFTTDKGYPLLTTEEMPFPHVFQAQVAPWSGAPKSELGKSSQDMSLKIEVSSDASGSVTSSDSAEKKPADETGGRMSSRIVPDTFRRVAELTGLRREQSGKGSKGFLEDAKNSAAVAKGEELKEVVVDKDDDGKKTKKKKGKGEAGQEHSVEDDPAQDNITGDLDEVNTKDKVDGLPNKRHGEPSKHTHHHRHHHKREAGGAHKRKHKGDKQKEKDKILPTRLGKTTDDGSDDDKPAPFNRVDSEPNTQQRAVIIDEHDESDSYDDDHVCKKLQPLLRYVEYEYVINTGTGFANVFALIMSMLDKLGAF